MAACPNNNDNTITTAIASGTIEAGTIEAEAEADY